MSSSTSRAPVETVRIEAIFLAVFLMLLFINELLPKGYLVLWFSENRTAGLNFFFRYFTHLGDGLVFIPFCLFLFWIRFGYAVIAALTGVVLAIVSNVLKHGPFSDHLRPKAWFGPDVVLNFVEGVEIHSRNAFPSGHTATAVALALLVALFARKGWVTGIVLIYACLVGLSRVYLAQHFFEDVVFGFLEGAIVAAGVFYLSKVKLSKRLNTSGSSSRQQA